MFAIGDKIWPGISKLVEECGEVIQICGKLMGTHGLRTHWNVPDLKEALELELGDLMAAIHFVGKRCKLNQKNVERQMSKKLELFEKWHHGDSDAT